MEWDTVIGLEVHAQLKTKSKLFSGASTAFGAVPNSHTCFIDSGLPGVLPVLNQQAVIMAIQLGLAINADINDLSIFERKNYFYPDLPKGYQISQFQKPIVSNGQLKIQLDDGSLKIVDIVRAHLEEDAGKSLHEAHNDYTGIDLNRAGTPLLEIVTAPCLYSAEEAIKYLKTLHQLVRFLGICDGNMQEGSFRCDVNLSIKPKGSTVLGTRTELKNLNSFRFIEKAIAFERSRHQDVLESGKQIIQETRLYNPDTNSTHAMRDKENENDYRYFPDPDLLPIQVTRFQIAEIKNNLPDLPEQIARELKAIPSLNDEDMNFILSSPEAYQFYKTVKTYTNSTDKLIINWLKGQYAASLNEHNLSFETPPISAQTMAKLLDKIQDNTISSNIAKIIFTKLWDGEDDVDAIIQREGYQQMDNSAALEEMIVKIIHQYPDQAAEYKAGKEKLLGFFVGQIMKQTKGQANPEQINALVKKHLISS
ncbi:Asp-tRNA(Asn)/Glu-tRNA(Gln) amidotransferase subunit GatB [Legionella bononiensis]|uniref:Aspartyl/glutamyl-tRNA(Asn/Gln) amidotransferase subunit B n=1 Tax=Legionella bononiensis TaxID=2793102 RepID=A0ABS1WCN5_9GAMM|nr:Asp-tRNA(Asn)/Glu-tRNA(Gln) amidotransferase subunit GatB [Legionella bononiensis]MBL7478977.1 Asp-tRNA(Asn)/Glu-tRNA(Gln) amidotransferase subunit GatB [Legionella bononiensis]MBL7527109.1 Asp-tRNA(Asn)/Glu-tRNA(Gln) amidotransferase subunit GatB [Legionella bononiensis]MBL7562078.1 Asp-tRNA(Asn)/Glu-tRNA(Gln) amidotransferase subunit GatB [Legionella bononiensis]